GVDQAAGRGVLPESVTGIGEGDEVVARGVGTGHDLQGDRAGVRKGSRRVFVYPELMRAIGESDHTISGGELRAERAEVREGTVVVAPDLVVAIQEEAFGIALNVATGAELRREAAGVRKLAVRIQPELVVAIDEE